MDRMNKKVLMIARSFPPFRSVGGSIRIVKFIKYLPSLGWNPSVVTIDDRFEYETWRRMGSESLLSELPADVIIHRLPAGERSLTSLEEEKALGEKYPVLGFLFKIKNSARRWFLRTLLLPDRYIQWLPIAVKHGQRIIKEEGVDILFTTSPSFSVCIVGAVLKKLTGKPLIVDFRDDWIDTPWFYEKPPISRFIERRLEKFVIKTADKVTLVTRWSLNAFQSRYPNEPKDKFVFIPNGCDLEDFEEFKNIPRNQDPSRFTILHAGILNDSDTWSRRPTPIFQALLKLVQAHPDLKSKIKAAFTGNFSDGLKQVVRELGLSDLVVELGHLPKNDYIKLLRNADMLLAINYQNFATLIPGKIYEYWAAGGAPILLLSCDGAAQSLIQQHKLGYTVLPDDVEGITKIIYDAYKAHEQGVHVAISIDGIEEYSRKALTERLAQTFSDELIRSVMVKQVTNSPGISGD